MLKCSVRIFPEFAGYTNHIFSIYCIANQLPNMQGSLKSLLRKYEERFLTMDVPPLVCPQQDLRMSNYTFETGKMSEEEYAIVHNGPDFTEVKINIV